METIGKNIFSNMYIYEIIAIKLDCDGHEIGKQILKRYLHKEDAIRFKTDWEALWKKHTSNNECISPCWYDYRKDISINVVQVETKY